MSALPPDALTEKSTVRIKLQVENICKSKKKVQIEKRTKKEKKKKKKKKKAESLVCFDFLYALVLLNAAKYAVSQVIGGIRANESLRKTVKSNSVKQERRR